MTGGPLKLCVNGSLGSGKSTVAKALAERMGLEYFATGRIQRTLAEKLGVTILELNRRAETDQKIDTLIDAQFEPISAAHERIVFDSRLAWNFVPGAVKVRLLCHPGTSASRIYLDQDSSRKVEAFEDLAAARASIELRRQSERKRFVEYYAVDIEDLGNYDLALQTDLVAPDQVVAAVEGWLGGERASGALLLNPRMVFPLRGGDVQEGEPISVVFAGDCFFALGGTERLAKAASAGAPWIAARRAGPEALSGVAEADFARARLDQDLLIRWQVENGFRFTVAPEPSSLSGASG